MPPVQVLQCQDWPQFREAGHKSPYGKYGICLLPWAGSGGIPTKSPRHPRPCRGRGTNRAVATNLRQSFGRGIVGRRSTEWPGLPEQIGNLSGAEPRPRSQQAGAHRCASERQERGRDRSDGRFGCVGGTGRPPGPPSGEESLGGRKEERREAHPLVQGQEGIGPVVAPDQNPPMFGIPHF